MVLITIVTGVINQLITGGHHLVVAICSMYGIFIYLINYITGWSCSGKSWCQYSSTMVRIWGRILIGDNGRGCIGHIMGLYTYIYRYKCVRVYGVSPFDNNVGKHNSNLTRTCGRYIELVNKIINQQTKLWGGHYIIYIYTYAYVHSYIYIHIYTCVNKSIYIYILHVYTYIGISLDI